MIGHTSLVVVVVIARAGLDGAFVVVSVAAVADAGGGVVAGAIVAGGGIVTGVLLIDIGAARDNV